MKFKKLNAIFSIIILLICSELVAQSKEFTDIVILKNGNILNGVKTTVTKDSLVVNTNDGQTTVYKKKEVAEVKRNAYKKDTEIETKSNSVSTADESTLIPTAKKLVGYIRFKKNDQALALIDTKTFSKNLLLNHWDKIDPKDQLEFEEAMKEYIKNKSFPMALQYFDKIDINYEKAKVKGKEAELPASILYKGSEKITFSWIFTETNGKFLVSDFLLAEGKLASEVNRVKQMEPTYEKKGMKELIVLIKKASK